jgi:uncharacterized glyoxalase superfamily protein PhnB
MQQLIIPMLSYENGSVAMDWLCRAFGFKKKEEWLDETGKLSHGEIEIDGQIVMLATPSPEYICPARVKLLHADTAAMYATPYVVNGVLVYVHNVEHHFEVAKKHGAVILSVPEDTDNGKIYRAEDPEGQRWMFLERAI